MSIMQSEPETFNPSDEDAAWAAQEFALEPVDPAELERLARHFEEVERYDPSAPDLDETADYPPVADLERIRRLAVIPDDFPLRTWELALVELLTARGYSAETAAAALRYAQDLGTLEGCAWLGDDDRRAGEVCLPMAPASHWAVYEGDVWNLVETAVGRR